jgi:hypothetical protein
MLAVVAAVKWINDGLANRREVTKLQRNTSGERLMCVSISLTMWNSTRDLLNITDGLQLQQGSMIEELSKHLSSLTQNLMPQVT